MDAIWNFLSVLVNNLAESAYGIRLFFAYHIEDLLLNLIAEVIGIVLTVWGIDNLIKRQEAKRWKPATGLLLSDLLNITDELIFALLPKQLRTISSATYKFGNTSITTSVEIDKRSLKDIIKTIRGNIGDYHSVDATTIDDVHRQMEYVLRFSSIIMQPILFNHLLSLDRALAKYRRLRLDYKDSGEKAMLRDEFTDVYVEVLSLSVNLRDNLIEQADSSERGKDG